MTLEALSRLALEQGFSQVGEVNTSALKFLPEIRQMCSADKCGKFGRCWTCPPYCASLEEISQKARGYSRGLLLQSTGQMEDDFDYEAMMDTERLQKERFFKLVKLLKQQGEDILPMSAGGCTLCESCGCPETPCRFPELATPSMEAYGLFVSDVCSASNLGYYYGPKTITFTSCILIR